MTGIHGSQQTRAQGERPGGPVPTGGDGVFRRLFDGMPDGCAHCRMTFEGDQAVDWTYLEVNPAFAAQSGLGEAVGRKVSDLLPDLRETSPDLFATYGRVARGGPAETFECFVPALGSWFEVHACPAGPDAFFATFRDITQRKRDHEALVAAEARFRALFELLPAGVTLTDATGRIVKTNPASEALLGIPSDDLLRRDFQGPYWDILRPDGSPMPAEEFASVRALKEGRRIADVEMGVRRPDGRTAWILVTAAPLPGPDPGVLITYVDISNRKAAEAALHRAHQLTEQIIQSSQEGIVVYDEDLRYRVWNPYMERLTGLPAKEVLGRHPEEVVHFLKEDGGIEDRRKVLAGEAVGPREVQYRIPSTGRSGWAVEVLSPLKDEGGRIVGVTVTVSDITDRKAQEQSLRWSEYQMRMAQEIGQTGSWIYDLEAGSLWGSAEAAGFFGFPRVDGPLSLERIEACIPDRERVHQALMDLVHEGRPYDLEYTVHPADGGPPRVIHSVARFDFNDRGVPSRIQGFIQDITRRRAAEAALRESEARFRTLADTAPVLIWLSGLDRKCTWFNKVWLDWTGRSLAQEEGDGWAEGVHPDDLPRCVATYADHFQAREPFTMEYRLRHHGGGYRWLLDRGTPRHAADGTFMGFVGACIDVHDQKEAEAALRESEARYAVMAENSPAVLYRYAQDRGGIYYSPRTRDLLGLAPEDLLAHPSRWHDSIHPEDLPRVDAAIAAALEHRTPFDITYRIRTAAGEERWFQDRGRCQGTADGERVIDGVAMDVTETQRLAEALRASETRLGILTDHLQDSFVFQIRTAPGEPFRFLHLSAGLERLLGLRTEEVLRDPAVLAARIDPAMAADYGRAEAESDRTGGPFSMRLRLRGAGGDWRWFSFRSQAHLQADGSSLRDGIATDITDQVAADAALQAQVERYAAVMDTAMEAIHVLDHTGRLVEWNPAFLAHLGYSAEEAATLSVFDWEAGLPRAEAEAMLASVHGSSRSFETLHRTRDGRLRAVEVNASPMLVDGEVRLLGVARDITGRKEAERAAEDAKQRLSSVLESAGDVIAMMDTGFHYTAFNTAFREEFQRIFGIAVQAGDSMLEALEGVPEDLAHAREYWARALGGEDFTVEQQFGDAALGRHWYELHFSPIRDPEGRVTGAVHIVRNTTGRNQLEADLKRLLREREIILDNTTVGLSVVVDRQQVWVNRRMEEIFGWTAAELVGGSTRRFYPSAEAFEELGRSSSQVLARGDTFETVQELLRKDGRHIWVNYSGRAIDPLDLGKGVLWIITDVTARKEGEDALRESEARFRSLFESHTAVMLLVDPADGSIVDANPAAAAFYGYPREVLRDMRITDINTLPPDQVAGAFQSAFRRRRNAFIFQHRLASGDLRTVEVNSSPASIQGRDLLFSIIFDITEQQLLETALSLHRQELEELNQGLEAKVQETVAQVRAMDQALIAQGRQAAMGEMIGHIAHQWRQPLNALSMVLANLKDAGRFGELSPDYLAEAVSRSDDLIRTMSTTIDDFRDFLRPEKVRQAFPVRRQVEEVLALLDASFRSHGIAVALEGEEDPRVDGYPNEVSQVLMNLLANAREAVQGTGRPGGEVRIRIRAEGRDCLLALADTGGGLRPEVLERIFEPYFTTKSKGTGLGLYMSKKILAGMGGDLRLRNIPGGAEATVFLPLAEGGDERPA